MYKIYISCPYDMPMVPPKIKKHFESHDVDVKYSQKGVTYRKEWLEQADAVIFVLPNMNFKWDVCKLTNGVLKELVYCLNTRMPYYVAYTTSDGKLGIYPGMLTDDMDITGVTNARDSITVLMDSNLAPSNDSSVIDYDPPVEDKALTSFETTY